MPLRTSDIALLADDVEVGTLPNYLFSSIQKGLNDANVTTPLGSFSRLGDVTRVAMAFETSDNERYREASSRIKSAVQEFLVK